MDVIATTQERRVIARFWLGLGCLLLAMVTQASEVYQGKVGRMPVVMTLDTSSDGTVSGRYFYRKYRKDIPLSGKWEGKTLQLSELWDNSEPEKIAMLLERSGNGLQGTWAGKKPISVVLKVVDSSAIDIQDPVLVSWRKRDLYELMRLEGLSLKPGKRESFQGYSLQWLQEPQSKIAYFRITSGLPAEQLGKLNHVLAERQWSEVASYFQCMSTPMGGEFDQTVTPRFISPNLLSASIFTGYFCGGAHPDFGDSPLNINLATGEMLTLEDLLWVGSGAPVKFDSRSYDPAASEYKEKYLAPWLVNEFRRLYPNDMVPDAEECNYADPSVWEYASWYMTEKGIVLDPSFPRVERNCELTEWSILPWSVIKQHPGRLPRLMS
ncbi:hypothetical protein ACK31Z_13270 [Aeromonas dhakensis]|uniref:hypothetical protein n=1 Tax=Aeromonas dhakensis TaxID=196024 RepID=UPI0024483912|nr:hypothetical protein [Aeromonas dhakensis]MDH0174121.1 hypothetical protein [Aeromonas dhakensis]